MVRVTTSAERFVDNEIIPEMIGDFRIMRGETARGETMSSKKSIGTKVPQQGDDDYHEL